MRVLQLLVLALLTAVGWAQSPAAPTPDRRTVVFLGDSLTAGYGLTANEAFPAVIQRRLAERGLAWDVVNAGISGDTTSGGLARLGWLLRRRVDVLVLALGGNDGLRGVSAAETKRNLTAIITQLRAKYPNAQVVLCGMQLPPNMGGSYGREFQETFPAVAREQQTEFVPFLLEGVGGVRELNQDDRIHPTAAGQEKLADNVWAVLEPLLRRIEKK